jgi:hypothetical protein
MKPSEILKDIKKKPHNPLAGICFNFEWHENNFLNKDLDAVLMQYEIFISGWPNYSGIKRYPVPHTKYKDPEMAYANCNKWSKSSKYGRMRWELLDWLIEQFESKGA